jgi:hypothetical protein
MVMMMMMDSRSWAQTRFEATSLAGKPVFHLQQFELSSALAAVHGKAVPGHGMISAVVVRGVDGIRHQPTHANISVDGGLVGDRWSVGKANRGDQISMMNVDVACVIANGQSVVLFGDNLFTCMDLSEEHLPVGSLLQVGDALLQVSEKPHVPCGQFRDRFGTPAFESAAKNRRVRGVYLTVIGAGSISLGGPISVVDDPMASCP